MWPLQCDDADLFKNAAEYADDVVGKCLRIVAVGDILDNGIDQVHYGELLGGLTLKLETSKHATVRKSTRQSNVYRITTVLLHNTDKLGYDRLNGTRKIGPSYAKSVIYIWHILDMHGTGTKHIVHHRQKSVVQWSVISKFTCSKWMDHLFKVLWWMTERKVQHR